MNAAFFNILSTKNNKTEDLNQTEDVKFSSESTKESFEEIYSSNEMY